MPVSLNAPSTFILGPDQQVPDQPVELYRRTVPFVLDTGGVAEQIVFDATASTLSGQFQSHSFDARPLASTTLQAKGAATVLVTFAAPRRVRKVKVASGVLASGSVKIGLHRVDVDNVVDEATVLLSNNAAVAPTFADARFAIRLSDDCNVQPTQIEILEVISYPAGPRLGVTLTGVTPAPEPIFFWHGSGEIGQGGEPADGDVTDGAAISDALARLLNRHLDALAVTGQPIPDQIQAALLIESNAPCRFQLNELTLDYRVVTESWLDRAGDAAQAKEVRRFSEQHLDSTMLSLAFPAGVAVQAATLRAVVSQASSQATASQVDGEGDAFPPPVQTTGFYVDHRAVALAATPTAAITATGLAVAVLPLSPDLSLQLALRADVGGAPAGIELASTTVTEQPAGQRRWITGRLPAPVPLSSDRVWLVLRAQVGACIWLAAAGDSTTIGVLLNRQTESLDAWLAQPADALPGLAYRFLGPVLTTPQIDSSPTPGQSNLTAALADSPLPDTPDGDTHTFDLTQALSIFLGTGPAPDSNGLVSVPITFRALGLRQATVYPPRLEFTVDT